MSVEGVINKVNMEAFVKINRKVYSAPVINQVELDNEISLALESNPPNGPDEVNNLGTAEYSIKNPYNKYV